MRILVAHLVGSARSGGMSRLMGRTHDELQRMGHEIEFLTADDVRPSMRGRAGRLTFQLEVRRVAAAAARQGRPFDVVNVHEPHGAMVATLRGGLGRTAVVAMTHGVERRGWEIAKAHAPSRPSIKTRMLYPLTSLWLSRLALRHADHVICLNRQDRDFLHQQFGIDRGDITPVTPGADPVFGMAAHGRTYAGARRLLFAGTWISRKGTRELVEAVRMLLERGADIHLDVVGAGVAEAEVLRCFGANRADRVHVLPGGDDTAISRVMADADVFVLPSLFEGTPLTLIEAMWSGLPVVTTATAGMQDVVTHERTGLLVAPGDSRALAGAIARLIEDPALRAALGTAAHDVASSSYTWTQAARTFDAAYRAACARHD